MAGRNKPLKPLHDWSEWAGKAAYGWKSLETGKVCQNVIADSPESLFKEAGLKVDDPKLPYGGFLAVPVAVALGTLVEADEPVGTSAPATDGPLFIKPKGKK